MKNQNPLINSTTCRDCMDYDTCDNAIINPDIPCEYYVPRYSRIKAIRTVGELVTVAMKHKITLDRVYNDYLNDLNSVPENI